MFGEFVGEEPPLPSFNDIFDGYQDEYNNHKLPDPEPEIEPKEPSPGLWDHITSAADTTWKALNSLTNAIGDGLYAVGDGVWNGTEYLFRLISLHIILSCSIHLQWNIQT